MRRLATILQGYALVGLIIVWQRPALGAENVFLKLRLTDGLVTGSDVNARSSADWQPRQFDGPIGIPLRMSGWVATQAQTEDALALQFTHRLAEDSNVTVEEVGQRLSLQLIRSLDGNAYLSALQSEDDLSGVSGIALRSSAWMAALVEPELGLKLQLVRGLDENLQQSGRKMLQPLEGEHGISLRMSDWMSALVRSDESLGLQLSRSLLEDSYVDPWQAGRGLSLQLTRHLFEDSYIKLSEEQAGLSLSRSEGDISLRLSKWMEAPALSEVNGDVSSEIGEVVFPQRQRASNPVVQPETKSMINRIAGAFGVGLAPVRWGGYMSDVYRATHSSGSSVTTDHSQRLDLRASSYIWQPWFAIVSGGIGMARGLVDSGGSDGEVRANSLTGFGDMTLFPQSRFPFSAAFSVSDSSTSSSLTADDQTSTRYSLRQTYHPETGNSNYTASYQNSTLTSKLSGDDVVETLQGSYSNSIGNQQFGLDAEHTETSRSQRSEGLLLDTMSARHSYRPGDSLSIESNARMSDSNLRVNNTGTSTSRYMQAGSFAAFRPKENLPLNMTASINLFSAASGYGGVSSESKSVYSSIGASYSPTRNLSLGASGTIAAASAGQGATNITTSESVNAGYSGDPLVFGKFNYNWNVSGGASNQTSDTMGSTQNFLGSGSHGINRGYRINDYSSLNFSANQSASSNWSGEIGQTTNLNHSGSVSWQFTASDSMSGSVNLSATDTRSMGAQESENQFVSLQGNGHVQLSTYSSATANIGVQLNRQGSRSGLGGDTPATTTMYTNGSASYQNSRAFSINNLRYSLLASMNMQQTNARLLGDANADTSPMGYSLEQHLDYNIGRIDIGLTGTVSVQNDRENALLFLRIGRSFGNY